MSTPDPIGASTPFPQEEAQQLEPRQTWNPWQGTPQPGFWQGMGLSEDTTYLGPLYRALEGAGQGAAKGEELLGGLWHAQGALGAKYLGNVPLVGAYYKHLEEGSAAMMPDARERVKALTPDPATTGTAAQIVNGLSSGLYRYTVGSLVGGPAGGAAMVGGTEAADRFAELQEQGVDAGTSGKAAALSGAFSAAGAFLPGGFGASLASKIATGAISQAGFGVASRYADHKVLEAAGYDEQAEQQKVWDSTSLATDLLLGGAFGTLAHLHGQPAASEADRQTQIRDLERKFGRDAPGAEDAALTTSLAMRDRASGPGVAVDPASANANQAALEKSTQDLLEGKPVDVSNTGVANATFAQRPAPDLTTAQGLFVNALKEGGYLDEQRNLETMEKALGARLRGEPAPAPEPAAAAGWNIPRATNLSGADRDIETRFANSLSADYEGMKARYAQLPDSAGGKILNTDTARELSPDYLQDRTKSAAVHEPASAFIKRLYAEKLAEAPAPGEDPVVLFTAGGTGAGKSSAIKSALGEEAERAQIVVDANMNGEKSALQKIDQALAAGKEAKIAYVHREPVEALVNGALPRAMRQEATFGSGRTVPIEEHINTHVGANDVVRKIAAHYANDPNVSMRVIDNNRGPGGAKLIDLEALPRIDYNTTRDQAISALEEAHAQARISPAVFRGFRGSDAGGSGREPVGADAGADANAAASGSGAAARPEAELGAGAGGQPQLERARERPDQLARVATATGRSIDVRPKVVEASDLVTSDHPSYPQELQPRQRGDRVALQEQVRSIAQNLDPARLGASAEADRGAPIVNGQNVVESGNGRVMALRQVYGESPEKAQAYRDWLASQGHNVEGMKQPVLVRERLTPMSAEEQRSFTVEANQAATAALSPVERAQADSRILDGGVLSQLRNGDLTTGQNAPFVRAFLARIPESERNALLNPDGTVSQEGVRRLQAAILAKAYGGAAESNATLGRMLESTDNDMRSTMGALLDAAPAFARLRQAIEDGKVAPEYDLARPLTQAIETAAQVREKGQAVGEFLKQTDLLTKRAPIVDALIKALYDKKGERLAGREKVAQTLMDYADRASSQRLDQRSLFADKPLAPEELLAGAAPKDEVKPMRPGSDMFGLRTAQGGKPADVATQVAQQVLKQSPNLEIAGENGEAQRGRSELMAADQNAQIVEERAPDALSIASNCSGQRAA